MKSKVLLGVFLSSLVLVNCKKDPEKEKLNFSTKFELSNGLETATYEETISYYLRLAKDYSEINVQNIGTTDYGLPLHLVTFNPDANFNFGKIREDKAILFINNGIHPGESDGIDATMMLFRDLAIGKLKAPKNTVITAIPVYNVGGMHNRNSHSRANQNGPQSYGFRGNALNYDLNRDFIKMDTKNAATFASIFHMVKPDVFVDNHVSNGADYQYTLTHLFTQHNKLGNELGMYLETELKTQLEDSLQHKNWDITPYVNVFNRPPETGFSQFLDNPRYSTGYTTLWNTLGLMVETHMLKPYKKRVEGTYALMEQLISITDKDYEKIKKLKAETYKSQIEQKTYFLNWTVDTTKTSALQFKGYKADTIVSAITGKNRLKYDRSKPETYSVKYQNHYIPKDTISVPDAYILPKSYTEVLQRLKQNNVQLKEIKKDTTLTVETYRIEDYKTYGTAYEGHYPHYNTRVSTIVDTITAKKGDFLIATKQDAFRYLVETLEPIAVDSFFNWNFFDTVLQQKEGFSPYVFEDTALEIFEKDSLLKQEFEQKKATDTTFASNWYAQLDFIFKSSTYYEKAHLRYPIVRITNNLYSLEGLVN